MRGFLAILLVPLLASGCSIGMNEFERDAAQAYYNAQIEMVRAQTGENKGNPVLFELTPTSQEPVVITGGGIKVYAPVGDKEIAQVKQMEMPDNVATITKGVTAAATIVAPWVGVGLIANEMAKMNSNTEVNVRGDNNTTATNPTLSSFETSTPTVVNPEVVNPEVVMVPTEVVPVPVNTNPVVTP